MLISKSDILILGMRATADIADNNIYIRIRMYTPIRNRLESRRSKMPRHVKVAAHTRN
jgi:hypothetical protein